MQRLLIIFGAFLGALAVAFAVAWWWQKSMLERPAARRGTGAGALPAASPTAAASAPAKPLPATAPATSNAAAGPPAAMPAPAAPPAAARQPPAQAADPAREEAEAIALNLRSFGQRFGGNPTGTNAEIVKTLNGGNPQGVRYLPQEHVRLNEQGELLDSFGTPYFFHQLSAQEMEIRSAGPDKTLWTQDDIAVK